MRPFALALLSAAAFGQSSTGPSFDIADVHVSAKVANPYMTGGALRGGRYDLRNATMLDLIQTAYGVDDNSKIVGGPGWINTDRFDVAAKAPQSTSAVDLKLMLKALLAERFKLVVHNDTRPLTAFVLSLGKGKPKLKEANDSGKSGCQGRPQSRVLNEIPDTEVSCRNMTMEAFAGALHQLAGNYVPGVVVDQTGLKAAWDFDLKWTGRGQLIAAGSSGISLFDAIDKQLGLKLESQPVPTAVIVVDSVNQIPTDDRVALTSSLPPPPAKFDVASIRLSAPGEEEDEQVGNGRVELKAEPLKDMIKFAWNIDNDDLLAGVPKFMDAAKFDVAAKAEDPQVDIEDLRLMVRALLEDRFKLAAHMETRAVNVYTLTAAKPKMQKADPSSRSGCKDGPGPEGKDPRLANPILNMVVSCRNTTMAQLAEQFQDFANGYIQYTVVEATGLEGGYDFTLNFSTVGVLRNAGRRGGNAGPGTASEPSGGLTLFEAVNKQLGLKLELQKRPVPVLVIDHVKETPTDN